MNGVIIAVVAIACILAGAMLLAIGLFFWYLLKVVRQLNSAVAQFTITLDPLMRNGSLLTLANSAAEMVAIGREALLAMKNLDVTVGMFNKIFFKQEALDEKSGGDKTGFAPPETSARYSYSEDSQARTEAQERLRKLGFETDAQMRDIPPAQMKHAQV